MNKKTFILLGLFLAVLLPSCKKGDDRPVRGDFITVYETSPKKTVDNIQIPFEGVQDGQIHILSNLPLQWKYLIDQTDSDTEWLKIKSVDEIEPGHIVVTYDAASLLVLNSLQRREGRLSFSCPSASFGKFLAVRQGYKRHFLEEFDDEPGDVLTITGRQTYTTDTYPELNADYFDYIAFNAWAETDNEFLMKNITLDVTVSGGQFYDTCLSTYRINVPIGTGAEESNLKYLLLMGNGERMSPKTHFIFSTENDEGVFVHIDNFSAYQVSEADLRELFEDEDFDEEEVEDWV